MIESAALRFAALCGGMLALSSQAAAQALHEGDRARIVLREAHAQDEIPGKRQLILRGDVTRVSADTVFLRPPGVVGEIGIPTALAVSLHRSLGRRSRPASAIRRGFAHAVVGALYFGLFYKSPDRDFGVSSRGEAVAAGAGFGAATGLILGALMPTERWQRVRQ